MTRDLVAHAEKGITWNTQVYEAWNYGRGRETHKTCRALSSPDADALLHASGYAEAAWTRSAEPRTTLFKKPGMRCTYNAHTGMNSLRDPTLLKKGGTGIIRGGVRRTPSAPHRKNSHSDIYLSKSL